MRSKHVLAAALAVGAFAIPVSPSHADPGGCVTTYAENRQEYYFTGVPGVDYQIKPEPEVHLYPTAPVAVAVYIASTEAAQAGALVTCIV
ncbi:MAG TPA: hypothetical protein VNQ77_10990 [Frankiaceae bacterium]|nr:hypothetical protein [Frankiaceae bacterium]